MVTSASIALFFTVVLLATTAYFLLGSIPLLILKHEDPVDASFIRSFFNLYYRVGLFATVGSALSYALAQRPGLAFGSACLAGLVALMRARIIPAMQTLGEQMPVNPAGAIAGFRRTHLTAVGVNMGQLLLIVWALTRLGPSS